MISRSVNAGDGIVARLVFTDASDGDFCVHRHHEDLVALRNTISASSWTWLEQVHGSDVVIVDSPGARAGERADAAVTSAVGCVLAVHTADCAPVVIVGNGGVGVAHAGWRGIVSGVIPATVARLREIGVTDPFTSLLGPCIRPEGYEFGDGDLDAVTAVVGSSARGLARDGRPALDMGEAVAQAVSGAANAPLIDLGIDTAEPGYFSHRTRSDNGRQATVVWLEEV